MPISIDTTHDECGSDQIMPGVIPVQQKASSACCGEKLQLPADPDAEHDYECRGCSKPAERVLGPKTAHWTCACGVRRSQVINDPVDEPPAVVVGKSVTPVALSTKGA